MYQRALALSLLLLLPQLAAADPIVAFDDGMVTWEAFGTIHTSSQPLSPIFPSIPIGTAYSMRITFNPNATRPTLGGHSVKLWRPTRSIGW